MLNSRSVFSIFLFLSYGLAFGAKKDGICDDVVAKNHFAAMCSHISLLRKADRSQWLIKQRRDSSINGQFICVTETLGGSMAEFLGIPCNKVKLVPAHSCTKYKKYKNYPATLHNFLPGKMACYKRVNIYQPVGKRCRNFCGMSDDVVKNMSQHPTLPLIVALDTFMGGTDRGCANVMYDEKTNTYYGIDFGSGFSANLAGIALENMKLIERMLVFTPAHIEGLTIYRNALKRLVNWYKPSVVYARLESLAHEAGLFAKTSFYTKNKAKLKEKLSRSKKYIYESYASTVALIRYLDQKIPQWNAKANQLPKA